MTHITLKTKQLSLILTLFSGLLTHQAQAVTINSNSVPINPVITTGSEDVYTEEQPNIWFVLDDSGSMGSGIRYNPNVTYVLPKKINGGDMPIPYNYERLWYPNAFFNDANGTYFQSSGTNGWRKSSCRHVSNKRNCAIWQNYYSDRMRVLKSALSLNFFNNEKIDRLRVGYLSLHNNTNEDYRGSPLSENRLPVLPLYGNQAEVNKKKFNKWLYRLYSSGGTPLRGRMASLFSDIITQSKSSNTGYDEELNPFLKIPGEDYDSTDNPLQVCRRNYAVILTDGSWNGSTNTQVNNALSSPSYIKSSKTESNDTLPDGIKYTPRSPYTKIAKTTRTLADIAFAGWKTDMDNQSSNNDMAEKSPPGVIQTLHGSTYWHPYNDPASWQHINTFTIGFGLSGSASVNPPQNGTGGINPTYIADAFKWNISVGSTSISGGNNTVKDLANAAVAGRGRFYNAQTADDLKTAFDDIVVNATTGGSKPGVKGSAGAVGISQNTGNAHYGTQYDINSFTGELTRTELYNGVRSTAAIAACFDPIPSSPKYGQLCTKSTASTNAATKLTAKATNSRKIITMRRMKGSDKLNNDQYDYGTLSVNQLKYEQISFLRSLFNKPMRKRLRDNLPTEITDNFPDSVTRLDALVSYTKGDGTNENTGIFRKREFAKPTGNVRNILGAIMRSSPVFTGVPLISSSHPGATSNSYRNFIKRYLYKKNSSGLLVSQCTTPCTNPIDKDYVNMIYVGSNDGMLHAFRADTLDEVFAYVPNAIYDNLPNIVTPKAQQILVDGGIDVQTVNIVSGTTPATLTTTWKQILVGALGGGGKGLYSLDVTNPQATNLAKWEYSDFESKMYQKTKNSAANFNGLKSNIGNIIAKPAIVQLSDGTWAAVVGNGYNAESNKAALIIINADTGKPIQELVLDNTYTDSSNPNGLGPLYFAAYPNKSSTVANRIDRAYAGDLQGNLWVFDFSAATKNGGVTLAKQSSTAADKPLFVAKYTNASGGVVRQPITVAPLVKRHPSKYGYLVHFGTGSLFAQDDLSSNIKNSIYAIWDDWLPTANGGLPTPRLGNVVERSHLQEVEYRNLNGETVTTYDGTEKKARLLKDSTATVNPPIKWAFHGNDFTHNKRGWYVDLLVGERAWQAPYDGFGTQNAEGIHYDTTRYQSVSGSNDNCSIKGSGVVTWRMAFNPNDGTQPLPFYGTLDLNGDGSASQNDVIVTRDASGKIIKRQVASGFQEANKVVFSSTPTNLYSDPNVGASNRYCNYKTQFSEDTNGDVNMQQTCRESHSGSWTELK